MKTAALALAAAVMMATYAAADEYEVVALHDGNSWNVQTADGIDVTARGEGAVKAVSAGDHRVKVSIDGTVVSISPDGSVAPVVAHTPLGDVVVVATVERGHVMDIKAVLGDGLVMGIKAFGPHENTCAVKGLDLLPSEVEGAVAGVEFIAHVKAVCDAR